MSGPACQRPRPNKQPGHCEAIAATRHFSGGPGADGANPLHPSVAWNIRVIVICDIFDHELFKIECDIFDIVDNVIFDISNFDLRNCGYFMEVRF